MGLEKELVRVSLSALYLISRIAMYGVDHVVRTSVFNILRAKSLGARRMDVKSLRDRSVRKIPAPRSSCSSRVQVCFWNGSSS